MKVQLDKNIFKMNKLNVYIESKTEYIISFHIIEEAEKKYNLLTSFLDKVIKYKEIFGKIKTIELYRNQINLFLNIVEETSDYVELKKIPTVINGKAYEEKIVTLCTDGGKEIYAETFDKNSEKTIKIWDSNFIKIL